MPSFDLRADHRQQQALSPRLQHAVRLLQMSSLDFAALVRSTLVSNPFLDGDDADPATGPDDGAGASEATGAEALSTTVGLSGADSSDSTDRDLWQAGTTARQRHGDDVDGSALEAMAAVTTLAAHLHQQLQVLPLPARDLALARFVVESLDDDGYLRTPLAELLPAIELDPPCTAAELQIALRRVQALDPAGVGARSVAECLQLQLPAVACPELRALAQSVVQQHLPALAAHDVAGLARLLDVAPERAEEVCDRIRRLDPRPGWRFGNTQVDYVVPDVVVRKTRGEWTVQLNPAVVPRVRLNTVYEHLFQRHRSAANGELGAQLQEARWTLRNVEQRFATILDVATAIVRRQKHFLDYGTMAMKPLGLREIADEVGIHESTVSRVTNNKYMATPAGVFELKYFFSRAMVSANGSACSGTAIRGLIKDLISAEPASQPLSDAEITRQLAQQGLCVARRTVTKYRQMLKIAPVDRRRRLAQ